LGAVSYAVGPAIVAALDKETATHVAGLVAIGGYYDIESAIGFLTSGCQRAGAGKWDCRPANPMRWSFAQANVGYLTAARDRFLLQHAAERKLAEPEFGLGEISAAMTEEGKALLALLEGHDPSRVAEHIAALPSLLRESILELDLKRRDLSPLRGKPWLIVHGAHDPIIPASQSEALAQAIGGEMILISNLAHATLNAGSMGDAFKLWRGVMRLLEMRDELKKGGAS
jgi:pimeloyl-ACP methyl ester carboxylesterase